MFRTQQLMLPRRFYMDIDYASHMPKTYVDRIKGHVPRKIYNNRFGAPPLTHWTIPPDDYCIPATATADDGTEIQVAKRPWQHEIVEKTLKRKDEYAKSLYANKFFQKDYKKVPPIPAEQWTIFRGDLVMVMVGKDKGKQGIVSHIIRDENAVFVEGLHMKLFDSTTKQMDKSYGITKRFYTWIEQPLYVHSGQVMLVDPNDKETCIAKWVLNTAGTKYIRVSTRTGYEIPFPKKAYKNYEYVVPNDYIEVKDKDTPPDAVLRCTYVPKLSTFEQEIEEEMGINKRDEKKHETFWY